MAFANASCGFFLRRIGISHSVSLSFSFNCDHHLFTTSLPPQISNFLPYFFQQQLWLSRSLRANCKPQNSMVLDERSRGSGQSQRIGQLQKAATVNDVVVPLCERTKTHAVSLKKLFLWRKYAQAMAVSVASRFCDLDGGPTAKELLRELDWYLDDAIAKCTPIMGCGPAGFQQTKHQELNSWRELKAWLSISDFEESQLDEGATFGLECDDIIFSDSAKTSADAASSTPEALKAQVILRTSMESLIENWQERIHKRRPFQYVVGCAHWRDLVLIVQEGVLIPRPETEQMIDLASAAIAEHEYLKRGVWADLGTGSGAIAIGLARLLEADGLVFAVDASEMAVAVATQNVRRHGLQGRVEVIQGSWFSPLQDTRLVGVLSNPPYIPSKNIVDLQAEVRKHEPECALDGGPNGVDALFLICQESTLALCTGGFLALETNGGKQAQIVAEYLTTMLGTYFCNVRVVEDYFGIPRFVLATHR